VTQDSSEVGVSSGMDKRIDLAVVPVGPPDGADRWEQPTHPSSLPEAGLATPPSELPRSEPPGSGRGPFRSPPARRGRHRHRAADDTGGGWCA